MKSLVSVMVLVAVSTPVLAGEPPDLVAYLDQIREWGMSEDAHGSLLGVSGLRLGHTILTYTKDEQSGRYWPRYHSTTCPNPQADPAEIAAWREELSRERDADIRILRDLADGDESGFVTTEEGYGFRFLVEFGYLAAQLVEEDDASLRVLAAAAGLSEPEARSRLDRYQAFLERASAAGLDEFPDASAILTSSR